MKKLPEITPVVISVGSPNPDAMRNFVDWAYRAVREHEAKKKRARKIAARKFSRSHKETARK